VRRRAHQRTTPMRGSARDVRRRMRAEPREIILRRFVGAGKDERSMTEDGTEEDLEAAIATDVVKRSPDNLGSLVLAAFDRRRQCCEAVNEHLRRNGRASGEKAAFGCAASDLCPCR